MTDPMVQALTAVTADLRRVAGCGLVWKDADPQLRVALPQRCTRHAHAYCRAVKADPARLARCVQADDDAAPAACADGRPVVHTCPFGVVRVAVPISQRGVRIGTALLGPFAGRVPRASILPGHADLPPLPTTATLLAVGRFAQAALRQGLPGRGASLATPTDALIAQALAWMGARATPQLRASAVARSCGLSTSRFLHRFAAACGEGFRTRLTRIICSTAAQRLTDPRRTVLSIALDCGYGDEDAFAAAFKRIYGLPPGRFRAQLLAAGG